MEPEDLHDTTERPDLDFVLQAVSVAEAEGLSPEQILDPEELAVYQEYTATESAMPTEHYDNLIGVIDDSDRKRLATDIINWVRWDEDTRRDWSDREKEGIRLLGVSDRVSGGAAFEGASTVVHPLLAEAVTQFHARALAEIWPPEGPVKSIVLGDKTPDRLQQAERVQDYMNYQYTEEMPGAFDEEDALLFRLPLSGSVFKHVYYDPLIRKPCSVMVEPADFIVPFSATNLATAPRYTFRYRQMHNDLLKLQASGYFDKDALITEPSNETHEYPEVKEEIDHTEGRERVSQEDNRHTILKMHVDLDLKGLEDIGADGEKTGIALPYIVWVDRDDQEVLRVQRNWKPNDANKTKKVDFAHYRFMPGLGFYGYGLLHLIGGLANSATGAVRALLDSAAFSNLQGGYKTRDARIKGGDTPLAPGEWREVDSTFEDLNKAFFKVPYKEPSDVLFKLLGYLDERGQTFVGGDVMTGDANPNAPVGTVLALIEQGGKSFSAVLRRLHAAHRDEFRILARVNNENLPEDGYPYDTKAGSKTIFAHDFDDRVDVFPVSDPNIISNSQRIVQAQAVLDLAEKHPDQVNVMEAIKQMLTAIRVSNTEDLMKVDQALSQIQQQSAQLDIQIKQAQLEKIQAERTEASLRGMFSAIQAANLVVMNPGIAPIADSIFKSGGGKDYDAGNLIDMNTMAQPMTLPQNTSPGFPAQPEAPQPIPQMPNEMMPPSPEQGMMNGIETARTETLQ
jgi:hypothetical protein